MSLSVATCVIFRRSVNMCLSMTMCVIFRGVEEVCPFSMAMCVVNYLYSAQSTECHVSSQLDSQ